MLESIHKIQEIFKIQLSKIKNERLQIINEDYV
jgi:hypothetical protein